MIKNWKTFVLRTLQMWFSPKEVQLKWKAFFAVSCFADGTRFRQIEARKVCNHSRLSFINLWHETNRFPFFYMSRRRAKIDQLMWFYFSFYDKSYTYIYIYILFLKARSLSDIFHIVINCTTFFSFLSRDGFFYEFMDVAAKKLLKSLCKVVNSTHRSAYHVYVTLNQVLSFCFWREQDLFGCFNYGRSLTESIQALL